MAIKPEYALTEFYVSLVTYTVMHMIFVISSDFVEAFNIPPLNIGIYADKLAAIRALLMVIADILEWLITQEYLHDPGAYKKLSNLSARRIGSVLSFFAMWVCRCHYIWLVYKSDNKSLVAFINLSIEGFWFGVFQMSFFAIGPEYNAFTSLAIHTMGNFIFFTQIILQHRAKSRPYINCLYRVRAHAWICLVITTISLGPWVWFCEVYLKGDTAQYQAMIGEKFWYETPRFDNLVEHLKTELEKQDTSEAAGVATKIRGALVAKSNEVRDLLQKDFGIPSSQDVKVEKSLSTSDVLVKIGSTATHVKGTPAEVHVDGSTYITIKVMGDSAGSVVTQAKVDGGDIAKRLARAVSDAASNVDSLKGFTVKSTTEDERAVKGYLAQKLRDSGSEKFKALVDTLKKQTGFTNPGEALTYRELSGAIQTGDVQGTIAGLLETEFQINITEDATTQISANAPGGKVTVTIGASGQAQFKGYSVVKQGTGINQPITIEVEFKTGVSVTAVKADRFAHRLVKAVETAKFDQTANLVEALVQKEFGIAGQVSVAGTGNEVEVKIGGGSKEKGSATVTVNGSQTITIRVKADAGGKVGKAAGRRIARRFAKTAIYFGFGVTKFGGFTIKMDPIEQHHVWSPFLLFIVGAFAEDFAVPGILPFAFLDPEKANLVNYFTPSFFFTGAFIILLLNDIFSGEQSLFGPDLMKTLDSQYKEWSEGAAHPWHGLWALNLLKYTAFLIAMWSIHGTFGSLRCIVQCRWRVMLLTMFIVVPRATLEVAGYVGVANFAIAQGETMDFYGFKFIAWHDMLAMFCRFVYGKFAVGYNWTRVSLIDFK